MEEVLPQLKEFIVDYCNRYKIQQVDTGSLCLDTSVDLDLDIFDIEIDLFLAEFAETFRVDNSKFTWYKIWLSNRIDGRKSDKNCVWLPHAMGKEVITQNIRTQIQGKEVTGGR